MIPPDVRHVRAYLDACEAVGKLAACYGAEDASFPSRGAGYVLLHFHDKDAETAFFARPDAALDAFETAEGKWLEASIMLGKIQIKALRKLFDYPGAA